ncbi:hypothetical protein [Aurantiacibacter marinus]|uniref:NIPSNAP domain-containing protein n=1 Tax=Aurantiacibacter marinus TaxID=874156 RepID=A0A0H0XPV6_9SPHN|nr:hypothetical protein [Aurantiacibacter marinus]KLI64354.1 hypothetical protein AAV99_01630 [Aurantiacibacter marinus]
MKRILLTAVAAILMGAAFPATVAAQDDPPLQPAEYVEVSAIHIDDGHQGDYANHLATFWRRSMDYRVEQGWINSYEILANVHAREDEPDLYLLTRFSEWTTPEEGRARGEAMRAHMAMTVDEMQQASAGRAEYRTLGSETLLRRLVWND